MENKKIQKNKKDYLPESEQPLSEIKKSLTLQKLYFMLKSIQQKNKSNITTFLKDYLCPITHPEKPNFDYNELTKTEKKKRVLLSLEKINEANHHLFSEKEKKILTPSRQGIWQKMYYFGIHGINFSWAFWTLSSKSYFKRNLRLLGAFSFANYFFLQSLPLRAKERVRFWRGLRLAEVYLEKEKGSMDRFVAVLNPFVSHHYLEHFKFD